ncbi:MAG: N-acetyl sugar amidotransferase [Candidatus Omnitrophica bacterium]|nr:N-acetyl sugar amidotransferase [Candidatus Omnitrophota bacterium]
MRRCSRCVIPETHETISFDDEGVCNVCRQIEYKQEQIDWNAKREEFEGIIARYRDKGQYDCIVPFSGGKDSTWTAYSIVREFKLRPLIVSFDHGFYRPHHLVNVEKTIRKLGCDFMTFRPNPQIAKKTMLECLTRKGDFCWHCHTGIFAYPMQIAVKFKIPLVIWGEPSAEYTSYYSYDQREEVDEKRFNRFINLGITAEDMAGMLDSSVTLRDLEPFRYPALKDLRALNYCSICLGSFVKWDVKKQSEIISKELGWEGDTVEGVSSEYYYEKIECSFQGIRDYCKYIKRGFSRMSHLCSIDIRNNRMAREEALKKIKEFEGKRPASLDVFLEYVGMTEEQFNDILIQQHINPYIHDFSKGEKGKPLPDMSDWHLTD